MIRNGAQGTWRRLAIHGLRVTLFAAALLLIRQHHELVQLADAVRSGSAEAIPLPVVRQVFPSAHALVPQGDHWLVIDAQQQTLGSVIQTSPESDSIIGFSGSTNVLIGFNPEEKIAGAAIIHSDDTQEHVAQVQSDPAYLPSLRGLSIDQAERIAQIDAVSGATLTSTAILESILRRLDKGRGSLRFPDPVDITVARHWWPQAARVVAPEVVGGLWRVEDSEGQLLGWLLRSSPAADNVIGYQGPSDAVVALDLQKTARGMQLVSTFDNQPYVDYVREDRYFTRLFDGKPLEELAQLDVVEAEIEGVSGATMTSMAVAEGIPLAARRAIQAEEAARRVAADRWRWVTRDWPILVFVLAGIGMGFSHLRGRRWIRFAFQVSVVTYLGYWNGLMISQAQLVGWAQHGVPWRSALGFTALTAAALVIPIVGGRNVYCAHLCPHGAVQQWIRPRRRSLHVPRRVQSWLKAVPGLLLGWCLLVAIVPLPVSLVAIEPFDAWVWKVAGWGTITVAVVGLVASLCVPMAYCRFGCPTGALLNYLRLHSRSDVWSARDWFALLLVLIAAALLIARQVN